MELKDYWRTIRNRWKSVVAVLVLVVAVASVVTFRTTPQYASSAQLFVSTAQSDTNSAYQGGLFATQRVTSYVELVDDRPLAERVSEALDGQLDADTLQARVSARVLPETVILEITATDDDPQVARDIAQAYVEQMRDLVEEIEPATGAGQDEGASVVTATIVDDARVATEPVSPQPVRNLGLALVLGLLLGVGLAVARELLDNTLSSPDDVGEVTDAPILGQIGADAGAVRVDPTTALGEVSGWAEAFRVLRTNMQYVEVDRDHKVFVVTSSLPAEGKSTTAVNLAITMSMANQRVLLIECDLRRPLVAARLGLDNAIGTTSVLVGKVNFEDAVQPYGNSGLEVLASGPIPPNPSELLQSATMEKLLTQVRSDYDVVIIDAPPLLPVTDAAILAAQVDGALLVARHGRTTRDQLRHAIERLGAVDARVLGIVMNLVPTRRGGSYGYGSYETYGGYAPLMEETQRRRDRRRDRKRKS